MKNKLLTIGTIVLLKNANKELMIIGYFPQAIQGDEKKTFDYLACPYPEGYINSNEPVVFNKENIKKVTHYAYMDEESKALLNEIDKNYDKIKNS